jgi:hypothetical protein
LILLSNGEYVDEDYHVVVLRDRDHTLAATSCCCVLSRKAYV